MACRGDGLYYDRSIFASGAAVFSRLRETGPAARLARGRPPGYAV